MVSEGGPVGAQEGVLEGLPGALGAIRQAAGDTELPLFSHYQPIVRQLLWWNYMPHLNLSSCAMFELCAL